MNNYTRRFKNRKIGNNEGPIIFCVNSKVLKKELLSEINNKNYVELSYKNIKTFKEDIKSITFSKIITDEAKIYKKIKHENIVFYKKANSKENLVLSNNKFIEEETYFNNLFSYEKRFTDKPFDDLYEVIKKDGKNYSKIVAFSNNEVISAIKVNKMWQIKSNTTIELLFSNREKVDLTKTEDLILNNSEIEYKNNYSKTEYFTKRNKWVLSELFYSDTISLSYEFGNPFYLKRSFILGENNKFEDVLEKMANNQPLKGIEYLSARVENDSVTLITKYGKFHINRKDNEIEIRSEVQFKLPENELDKFVEGIFFNLKSNINNEVIVSRFSKKQMVQSIAGLLTLILLITVTFSFIFDTSNLNFVFSSFGMIKSWEMPWLYLIIASFIFSFLLPFFIAIIMEKLILKKDKLDWKRVNHYFLAGALRNTATFLTGNFFIATFIWGWYINRKLDIRAAALVSTVSTISIIRAIILFIIGSIFMLDGTLSYLFIYNEGIDIATISVVVSAWFGFAWQLFHNIWVYMLIASPFIASLFFDLTFKYKNRNKKYNYQSLNENFFKRMYYENTKINLSWKNNKTGTIRMCFIIVIPIIIEGFESIYYFNYVDKMAAWASGIDYNYGIYWNFLSITGLRFMAAQIHHIPIINILPGKGMFFSEFGLNTLYELVYNHHHNFADIGLFSSEDLSQMTSFMTRFFNVYLNTSLVLLISIIVIIKELFKRKVNIK